MKSLCALGIVLASLSVGCGGDATTMVTGDGSVTADGSVTPDGATAAYTEALCDDTADLSSLASAYVDSPAGIRAATRGIAERRYPMGVEVIDVQSDMQLGAWFRQHGTFANILNSFEVAIHEGGHIWDFTMARDTIPYRVRGDLVIRTRRLTNFNRSEILTLHANPAADSYDEVYLQGQSGAQGFNTLLDEYVQYTHSLAARYCTRDGLGRGVRTSARDGILTLMYYVELYLKLARTQHPDDYAEILGDPGHIQLIRTVWQRAEFWLDVTASRPELGLRDAAIRAWTYAPENVMEITMLPAE